MENRRILYITKSEASCRYGTAPHKVLKSIDCLMQEPILDGDTIPFEGGYTYDGSLNISGRKNIAIGSIGTGHAVIKAGKGDGINLSGCNDCEIYGLRIGGNGWRGSTWQTGILLKSCKDVTVRNTEVFCFSNSGIEMDSCSDITITGCFSHHNGFCGINTCIGSRKNRNIRITYSRVFDNAGAPGITDNHSGSGIVIYHADGVLVEYCEAAGNGWAQRQKNHNGPVGIWCACDAGNVVFRKCISHHNRTQPGCVDGDGFDIDGAVVDGYMEYNYSYWNEGSGYLFCEYGSGMEWRNNNMSYCISINDGLRVPHQGSVQFYGPDWLKLNGSKISHSLFVPAKDHHCIINNEIGNECTGLSVTGCVLVEGTVRAVMDQDNPNLSFADNHLIKEEKIYHAIVENTPRITDPRRLDELPVFKYLESGSCEDAVVTYHINELFGMAPVRELPSHIKKFTYYLNGADFEGSDYLGDARLVYDSIQALYALRISGKDSFIKFQYPAWNAGVKHMAVLKARLESPDVEAYFYVSENDRIVKAVNITGGVSDYHDIVLEFDGFAEVPFIGVMIRSGGGSVLLQKIDICELSETDGYKDYISPLSNLNSFISSGDVYEQDGCITLNGKGSSITRYAMASEKAVAVEAEITADGDGGYLFIESGGKSELIFIERDKRYYRACFDNCGNYIKYGIYNNPAAGCGQIRIENIQLLRRR